MKIVIFIFPLFALALFCCTCPSTSMTLQQQTRDDTLTIRELRDYDTVGIKTALSEWRLDSLGCMQLRTVGMADYLVRQLGIIGKTVDEAVTLLGEPNESHTYKDWFRDREDKFLFLTYYIAIPCVDGKPMERGLNHCWLRLQIDTATKRILSAIAPCS